MAKLTVKLRSNSGESITRQIINQASQQIKAGRIKPGERLPSTLALSDQLGVAPESVRRAYLQLKAMNLIETGLRGSHVRGGKAQKVATSAKSGAKKATKKGTKKAAKKK
jgi:DNA-binding transcriptional regulator YhcF (GntR family)